MFKIKDNVVVTVFGVMDEMLSGKIECDETRAWGDRTAHRDVYTVQCTHCKLLL